MAAHDPRRAMLAAGFADFAQISEDSRRAVRTAADGVGITDELEQALIFDRAI
jgi:hypothetical protein